MSRRDTIIIAILVNAALLMVLFATAIRTDHEKSSSQQELKLSELLPDPSPQEDILNQYVASLPPSQTEAIPVETTGDIPLEIPLPTIVEQRVAVVEEVSALPAPKEEIKKEKPQMVTITVKKGDFLEKIAKANRTTVSAIMKANQMTSTQLKIGQVLKVPLTADGEAVAIKSTEKKAASTEGDYYTVKEGDSPWLIASRNHLKLDEFLRLNNLDEKKAKRLRPGDRLRIR